MRRIKNIICLLAAVCFCCLIVPERAAAEGESELHEEHFNQDYTMSGLYASCEESFHTEEWDIESARLTLYYTVTTLVREEVSDFTVILNDQPIYSQRLPLTEGETQKLTISLPERLISEGTNSVRIEAYIRTNEDDPCENDISGASWMTVRKDSYVSVAYLPDVSCVNVAEAYRKLTSIEGLENEKSAVFLPDSPTENEYTGAAYLMSGISRNAVLSYESLSLRRHGETEGWDGYSYGAYLCEYERLPDALMGLLNEEQRGAAQEGALIALVRPAEGMELLLVTGSRPAAFQNACRLFGNQSSMEQTKAVWRKVPETEDVSCPREESATTKLTEQGSFVSGPFRQTASFTVPMGASQCIADGSEAVIRMRYAQNLDFDRSLMTVYVGGVPIGSKRLEKDSADSDMLKVSIPSSQDVRGSFNLDVVFDLEVKDQLCDLRRQELPWAYVTADSTVSLRTKELPWLLFDYYPAPFLYEGRWNDVTFILPVRESDEDLEAMKSILLTMGRYQTDNTGAIRVCRAHNMGDLSASNIVSIGCLEDNPIVQQINNQLYFRFSPEGTTIRSNEKMKIEPNYGATLGTAQLLYSPYSEDKYALLVVSGVTREGMLKAAQYLGSLQKNWQIYGDGYVTDGTQVHCYRFGPDNSKRDTLPARLAGENGVMPLLLTGCCVLALIGISLLLIWRKHRRR